jgi:hypothetical protein
MQIEIINVLGIAVAVLDEYFYYQFCRENQKLYKMKDGNRYNVAEANKGVNNKSILIVLKLKIDSKIVQVFYCSSFP